VDLRESKKRYGALRRAGSSIVITRPEVFGTNGNFLGKIFPNQDTCPINIQPGPRRSATGSDSLHRRMQQEGNFGKIFPKIREELPNPPALFAPEKGRLS
jgi:hypothetical protein